MGEAVAGESLPVAERDGVVTVACRSAVWSQELAMLSPVVLERLNEGLGKDRRVRALRFVTGPLIEGADRPPPK